MSPERAEKGGGDGNGESVLRSLAVAVGVALFCSALVTAAVHLLRPIQAAYAAVERNRVIVVAAGLAEPGASDDAVVDAYLALHAEVVNLATGKPVPGEDGRTFDHWTGAGATTATDGSRPERVPLYLRRDDGRLTRVVLPLDGKGMWSTIRAYLALEADLKTVAALVIYDHGETPGIGDRIQNPAWLAGWRGRQVRDATGAVTLGASDDASVPPEGRIDTITGATVTSRAVIRLTRDWLDAYAMVLAELGQREGETP